MCSALIRESQSKDGQWPALSCGRLLMEVEALYFPFCLRGQIMMSRNGTQGKVLI